MPQTLVYLPGLDGTGRLLHRQPRLFDCFDVHCVAYPQDQTSTYQSLAAFAVGEIERAGNGPAIVLAESFGGGVALTLALRRLDLVAKLVLINTFAYYPRCAIIHLAADLSVFLPAMPTPAWTRGLRGTFFFTQEITETERNEWWSRVDDVPMSVLGHRVRMMRELDLRSRLADIQTPTIVMAAANDRLVPSSAGHLLARRMPNAQLIQMPVNHAALIHPQVDVAIWLMNNRTRRQSCVK